MKCKRILFPILFTLLIQSVCIYRAYAQEQKQTITLERFQAMINRDSVKLDALLSDDLTYIHSNGILENKKEHIRNIMSGKIIYSKMDLKEQSSKHYNETNINNGIVEVTGKLNGTEFTLMLRFTEVYKKNKNIWQLVNWQSTKIP
jgi:Domain of unknown function (DUF4440)